MRSFSGFPPGKSRFTPIPDLFFTELLPAIDDLAELKLTLYLFWMLNRQRGYPRYMTVPELEGEGILLSALGTPDGTASSGDLMVILHSALDHAIARGTLLPLTISDETGETTYLFANTPQGRKAIDEVKQGELILETTGHVREPHVAHTRANIFELYEQNIGLLQPLLAEELEEAELIYPPEWIVDAFTIAVENNARSWRYIKSILERWARDGKDDNSDSAYRRRFR